MKASSSAQKSTQNVISLNSLREVKKVERQHPLYEKVILNMDKLQLLEEMVKFQEERSLKGRLTPSMLVRGRILFRALEQNAETNELALLSRSYLSHLNYEYQGYLENGRISEV